jgi:hypothetical protein
MSKLEKLLFQNQNLIIIPGRWKPSFVVLFYSVDQLEHLDS